MQWYVYCIYVNVISFFKKNNGSLVITVTVDSLTLVQSTNLKLTVVYRFLTCNIYTELPKNILKNTNIYNNIIAIIFIVNFIFFSLDDIYVGTGIINWSYYYYYCCFNFAFYYYTYFYFLYLYILYNRYFYARFCYQASRADFLSGLFNLYFLRDERESKFIYYLPTFYYYFTYSNTTIFWVIYFMLSLFHYGRFAGVRSKHYDMSWNIPCENLSLLRSGFLFASNTGIYLVNILCNRTPKDHISIFYLSNLNKFQGSMIFYLS